MPEEFFYYNRQKSLKDGLTLIVVSLLFQPFYLIFHEGIKGIFIAILPMHFLIKGIIYFLRSLWQRPAIHLSPQGIEFETNYLFRKQLKWNEITSIELEVTEENTDRRNRRRRTISFKISDYENNYIVLHTVDKRKYPISVDGIDLKGVELEQRLRDFKRMYYFNQ